MAACARCGGFLCGACVVLAEDAALCAPCARLLGVDGPLLPGRVRVALASGVLGLVGLAFACSLPPVPTLLLGVLGLWVLRGLRPPEGAPGVGAAERRYRYVRLARQVAWANVVLASLYFVVLAGVVGLLWVSRRGAP